MLTQRNLLVIEEYGSRIRRDPTREPSLNKPASGPAYSGSFAFWNIDFRMENARSKKNLPPPPIRGVGGEGLRNFIDRT